jgi:UDP-2-acetamido-3-amino-2,3-dideoxy-glucuronate N-acetyltransferase
MINKKNIAILGAGNWGKNLIREFDKITNISYCLLTKNSQNKDWVENNYPKIKIVTDYKKILSDNSIDVIVIATPIKTHYKIAKEALLNKKNIFIEKPITTSSRQAKDLVKIANENNLTIFVGYIFLHHPIIKKIDKILEKEKIKYLNFYWEKSTKKYDDDIYLNLLSHDISIALYLLKEINNVKKIYSQKIIKKEDIINLKTSPRTNCSFYINRVSKNKNKNVSILTDKNYYIWEDDFLYKYNKNTNFFTKIYNSSKTPLENEVNYFIKVLNKKEKNFTDGKFGVSIHKILESIK